MSRLFQNIDPPPPSPPGKCVLPPQQRRGVYYTLAGRRGCGGQYFGRRQPLGLASYNSLSTLISILIAGHVRELNFQWVIQLNIAYTQKNSVKIERAFFDD
jgi:hypothetical protein